MKNLNDNYTLEEKYGAQPTKVLDADKGIMQYDVVAESLKTGQPLESIFENINHKDNISVNDEAYYNESFGVEFNKANPNALDRSQIKSVRDKALVLYQVHNKAQSFRSSLAEIMMNQKVQQLEKTAPAWVTTPFSRELNPQSTHEGWINLGTGTPSQLGTLQQMAEKNDKMLLKHTDVTGKSSYEYVERPKSLEAMHDMYGKNSVIKADIDSATGKPILVAQQGGEFVANADIYSTKFGADELFGSYFKDFFKGVYNGMVPGTVNSYNQVKALLNDKMRYDSNHLFTKPRAEILNYGQTLLEEVKSSGDEKRAKALADAMNTGDYEQMKNAFSMALSSIEPTRANQLRAVAQPLNWQEVNNEIQVLNNKMGAASMSISDETNYGKGAGAFMAQLGPTTGMMIPQVAIGMLTAGASSGISMMAGGARALAMAKALQYTGRALATTLGTSQAVSDVYRTGIEMGVDRELLADVMIWSLPAVAVTEQLTNGWLFKGFDDGARQTFVKEVYQPALKKVQDLVGKGASKEVVEEASRNVFTKLFKHPTFQKIIDSQSFLGRTGKAIAAEVVQENTEDLYYVALQKYVDANAPVHTEVGQGKYGAEYSWEQIGHTTAGTIFVTALMNTILDGVPRMIRKNKGMPDLSVDKNREEYMRYKVLNGEGQELLNQAHKDFVDGNWDPGKMKVKDITGDEDNSMYVVPKSEFLQSVGLEEGVVIEDINTMRFVEFATKLEAFQQLSKDMKMSNTDKSALLQLGVSGQLLMSETLKAMETMAETKIAIDAIAKPTLTGTAEENALEQEKYDNDTKELRDDYNQAKAIYDSHTTIEEGTGHSYAVNQLMKESVALLNQVNDKAKKLNNLTDEQLNNKKLKNNKKFETEYLKAWNDIIANKFGYADYNSFYQQVETIKKQREEQRTAQRNRIVNREDFNTMLASTERMAEGFTGLKTNYTRESLQKVLDEFSVFTKQLTSGLTFKSSYLNNQELEQLSSKYGELLEQAKQAVKESTGVELQFLKEQAKGLTGVDLETNEEQQTDIELEMKELQKNYLNNLSETLYDDQGNPLNVGIKVKKGSPQYYQKRGRKLQYVDYRNESDTDIELRQQEELDNLNKEYESYLDLDVEQRENLIKEIETWSDSVINKNDNYNKAYPNGRFKDSNAGLQARKYLEDLDAIKDTIINSFEIAKHIDGDSRYVEHATETENAFTKNLAQRDEEGKNQLLEKYTDIFNKIAKLKTDVGQAEYLERAKRDHMRTVMNETVIGSLIHIVDLGITDNDGKVLQNEYFDKLRNLGSVPIEILQANGNYSEQQMALLAQRESIMNNVLSFLQNNKDVVFNDKNKPLVFSVFEKFQQSITNSANTDYEYLKTSMFFLDDSQAVSGSVDQVKISREKMMMTPMKKGDYYFFEQAYGNGVHTVHESKMRLKELFNVLMWIDSDVSINDIVEARKEIINENKDQETAEQEYVSNSIIAFTTNTGVSTYEKLFNYLNRDGVYSAGKHKNLKGVEVSNTYTTDDFLGNVLTITGDYGVGKTQFVLRRAIELIGKIKKDGPFNDVSIVNITNNLEQVHKDTFSKILPDNTKFLNLKRDFIDNIDNIDTSENKIYIVDEASIITKQEYKKIVAKFKGTQAKIIFLGDLFQMRDTEGLTKLPYILTRTMSTHLLTEQFSSNSQLLRELADQPRSKAIGSTTDDELPVIWNTKVFSKVVDSKLMGGKYFVDEKEMVSAFTSNIKTDSKRAIIFANQAHLDAFINRNRELGRVLTEHSDKVYFAFRKGSENTDKLIQGLREEEVYVAINPLTAKDEFKVSGNAIVASALYTAIGRASNFIGLIGSDLSLNVKDEKDALSIGQPNASNNPIVEEMKNRFKAKNEIRFRNLDSSEYRSKQATAPASTTGTTTTTTTPTTGANVSIKVLSPHKVTVGKKDVTVHISIHTDKVSYRYAHNGNNESHEITTGNLWTASEADIIKEVTDEIIKRHPVTTSGGNTVLNTSVSFVQLKNGNNVTLGDAVEFNNMTGSIESITEVNKNGVITYEVELSGESQIQTINVDTDIQFTEIDDTIVPDRTASIEATHSYRIFERHVNNGQLALFGSSASLIGMDSSTTLEERNKRRNLNDLIVSNIKELLPYGKLVISYEDTSYLDDNNNVIKGKFMVMRFRLTDAGRFEGVLNRLKSNYKLMEVPIGIDFPIGTLTEPSVPEIVIIDGKQEVIYKSLKSSKYTAEDRTRLEKAWNDISLNGKSVPAMRDMQLAIFDLYAGSLQEFEVNGIDNGKRVIQYSPKPQTLAEFEDNSQHKITYGVAKIGNNKNGDPRIVVPISIGNEKHDLILAMPKYSDNPIALERLKDVLKSEKNFFDSVLSGFTGNMTDTEKIERLKTELSRTSLFKLLINNYSILNGNVPLIKSILKDLISIKAKHHIDLVGNTPSEFIQNYLAVINNIDKLLSTSDIGLLYDFARKIKDPNTGKIVYVNSEMKPLLDDKTAITTHAVRLNNRSIYPRINKPASTVQQPIQQVSTNTSKPGRGKINFEHVDNTQRKSNDLSNWFSELDSFLGDEFLSSKYLTITNNILRDANGRLVAGYVQDASKMVLSTRTGKSTTARHESFHFIFQNYIKPEQVKSLKRAARIISIFETGNDIVGNEEEWMAYDFGNKRTPKYQEQSLNDAIGIWEQFKVFIKNLLRYINPLYYVEKTLINEYNNIESGMYRNRLNEVKVISEQRISYSNDVSEDMNDYFEGEYDRQMNSEEFISTRDAIIEANRIKSELNKSVLTNKALVVTELQLGYEITDMSLLGTNADMTGLTSMNEVINDIIIKYENEYNDNQNTMVEVLGKGRLPYYEVERLGLGESIVSYDDKFAYDLHILSKPENIKALIQLKVPTYNMANNEWGTIAGPDSRFDWSNYKPEDYLSDDKKLFLSSVPRLKADGSIDHSKSTFIPFNQVTEILKALGSNINVKAATEAGIDPNNRFELFKYSMKNIIQKSKIKDGNFIDEKTQVIYSLYARIYGSIEGMPKVNYSDLNALNNTVGLMDKYSMLYERISKLTDAVYNENNELAPTTEIRGMREAATAILDFVNGLTTVYVSMYMKDMVKSTYYNNTIKSQRMFKETHINDSYNIMNNQNNAFTEGQLSERTKEVFDANVFVKDSDYKKTGIIEIKFKETDENVLIFENGKWKFVTDAGTAFNDRYSSSYKNVLSFMKRMKNTFGLNIMRDGTLERIMQAETWEEVTDIMQELNDVGYMASYMSDIKKNYPIDEAGFGGPIDFIADYLGTISYLMFQYKKPYDVYLLDGEDIIKNSDNLGVFMKNGEKDETLEDRLNKVDGSDVIRKFIDKTQPKGFERNEDNDDSEIGADQRIDTDEIVDNEFKRDSNDFIYYKSNDFSTATKLLASMIQKIEGKVNDNARLTAEGTRMHPYINRSAFNEQIMDMTEPVYGIQINSIVESVGMARNIGFTTYGTKNVETGDYIEQSLNWFAQGILKNTFYVPVKPASDTGTVRYMDINSSFLSNDGGFHIDYKNLATSLLGIVDNHNQKVNESRNRIISFANEIKSMEGFTDMVLDTNDTSIEDIITVLNNHATKKGLMPELIRLIEQSKLTKDAKVYDNGKMSNFDIGFNGTPNEKGIMIPSSLIPGRLAMDMVFGLEWMTNTTTRGNVITNQIRQSLKDGNVKEIERHIQNLFKNSYKDFGRMVVSSGFKPTGSVFKISNTVNKGILDKKDNFWETSKGKMKVNQLYFAYYMSTMISNYATESTGMDSESFNGFMDLVKRFGSDNTPGISPLINQKENGEYTGGLLGTSPIMVVRDVRDVFEETYKTKDGKSELSTDDSVEVENGQTTVNPLWYTFFKHSFGGTNNSILGSANAVKPLGNMKRSDGSYMLLKSAFHVLGTSDLKHDGLRNKMVRMLKESDKNFYSKLDKNEVANFVSFYDMFEKYYNSSTDKDLDKIMEDMRWEIMGWQKQFGLPFYEKAITSIVSMMAPISTIKSPLREMNTYDPLMDNNESDLPLAFDELDNNKLRAVMNPSQPTNTNKSQAQPSQFDAQMGVGEEFVRRTSDEYRANRSDLQDRVEYELKKDISTNYEANDGSIPPNGERFKDIDFNTLDPFNEDTIPPWIDKAFEQLESYLRKNVAADISVNNEDAAYVEMMNNKNVSKHLPQMRSRLIASYRNIVNRSVQGRTTGARLTQMSGYYHRFFTDENGNKMNKLDVLDQLNLMNGGWKALSFEEFNSYTDEVLATQGFTSVPLYDMSVGVLKTNTGTISMPNLFADKYGHRKDETLFQINTVNMNGTRISLLKNGESNTDEIFNTLVNILEQLKANKDGQGTMTIMTNFLNSPMVRKAVANLGILEDVEMIKQAIDTNNPLSENAAEELKNKYSRVLRGEVTAEEDIENAELLAKKQLLEKRFDKSFDELTATEKIIGELIKDIDTLSGSFDTLYSIIEEAVELSKDFNDSLQMMLSRVPLTFIGSGGVYDVVDFNNDNGNIVYIPIGMTNRNDADFDIDALTAYTNSIGSNGKLIRKGSQAIINTMNKQRIAIYTDKTNEKQLLIKSTTGNIKDVPKMRKRNGIDSKESNTINNSPNAIFEAYDRNKAGADAIGILANALNAISMIMTMKLKGKESYAKGSMMASVMDANIKLQTLLKTGDQSIIYRLGSWEQIALDNNKSNTLGAYNIRSYVVNILASLVIDGKTPEQIYDFFNNPNINSIFDKFAIGQRLKESSKKYDLYAITNDEIQSLNGKWRNSSLVNYNALKAIIPNIEVNFNSNLNLLSKQTEVAIDTIDGLINDMMYDVTTGEGFIFELAPKSVNHKYINDKKSVEDGVKAFRDYYKLTTDNILSGKAIDKLKEDIEGFDKTSLYVAMKAMKELNDKQNLKEAISSVEKLPNYIVMAEALFRLSQVMKLRNGLRVLDSDFNSSKIHIENMLGMSLKDYSVSNKITNLDDHMKYFMINNDAFVALKQESEKDGATDEDIQRVQYAIQKERAVFNELNISDFVRSVPQLDNIIKMFDQQDTLTQMMFLSDNPVFKQLTAEFMMLQKKPHMTYGNQIAKFNEAVYELVFDNFFINHKQDMTMRNITYDFSNVFDRQEFALSFPNHVMSIQYNASDATFWKQMLPFEEFNKLTSEDFNNLGDNIFLKSLTVSGISRFKLTTMVNTKQMTGVELSKYQDAYNQLPKSLQDMFLYYEIIENKMNFKKGSIMHIIGTDFYSGELSTTFNTIAKQLFTDGLTAFTKADNVDNLKDRFFDYLGMNEEFAVSVPVGKFDKVNGPKYIWNKGEAKTALSGEKYFGKKIFFFKKDTDGNYNEINRNTWKPAISVDEDTYSQFKSFIRNDEEIARYKAAELKGATTSHYSRMFDIEKGDILKTGKDLVVVTSIIKGKMNYRSATPKDVNTYEVRLNQERTRLNNTITLTLGTPEYNLLHIDAKTPITISDSMNIRINGEPVFEQNQKFESVHEALNYFHNQTLKMLIPNWGDLKDDLHISNSYRNILNQSTNINDKLAAEKQVAIMAHMYGTTVLLKEIMKARYAVFEADNKNKLTSVLLDDNNEFRKLGNYHDTFRIGKSTYSQVAFEAYREYMGSPVESIMEKEAEVLSHLDVNNISELFHADKQSLFKKFNNKDKSVTQVNVSTNDLIEQIESMNAQLQLSDNELSYELNGAKYIRFGNVIQWTKEKALRGKETMSFDQFTFGKSKELKGAELEFQQRKYDLYKKGVYLIDRTKKESTALNIGTSVDSSFRKFMNHLNEQIQLGKNDPTHIMDIDNWNIDEAKGMSYSPIQAEQLKVAITKYGLAWMNWAKANEYEIEFIADEIPVYSNQSPKMVNAMIQYEDASGNKIQVAGVASKLDMVVRLTKTRGGMRTTSDIVLDFKTINLGQKEEYVKSQVLGWNIQTHGSAMMYRENYGVSLHSQRGKTMYGIIPIETKYDKKKNFIGFGIPEAIEFGKKYVPIEQNIERWNNSDEFNKDENYMPMFRSELTNNPLELVNAMVGLKNEELGIDLANNYNNEEENTENEQNCKFN